MRPKIQKQAAAAIAKLARNNDDTRSQIAKLGGVRVENFGLEPFQLGRELHPALRARLSDGGFCGGCGSGRVLAVLPLLLCKLGARSVELDAVQTPTGVELSRLGAQQCLEPAQLKACVHQSDGFCIAAGSFGTLQSFAIQSMRSHQLLTRRRG
jgi:hypothetical protein